MSQKALVFVFATAAAFAAAASSATYSASETVTEALELNEDHEINVASGVTVTFEGAITSASGVTAQLNKTGAGTLILKNAGNAFSGGIKVSAGFLEAGAQGCLGDQLITLDGGQLRFMTKGASFANPIKLNRSYEGPNNGTGTTEASAGLQVYFDKDTTLTGGITAQTDGLRLRMGGKRMGSDSGNANWPTATFDCEVNMGSTGTIGFHGNGVYGVFKFNRKVTCGEFDSGSAWSAMGKVYFYAENAIGKYNQNSSNVYLYHADALKGTEFYHYNCWETGRGTVYPQVTDFQVDMFKATTVRSGDRAPVKSDKSGADVYSSSSPYTVHIMGRTGVSPMSYVRFKGPCTLIQEATNQTATSFVQIFDWVPSTMTGPVIVSNGTMRVTRGAGFTGAASLIVEEGAVFDCQSTSGCLAGPSNVVVKGSVTVDAGSESAFRADGALDLELGANAVFSFTNRNLSVRKLKVEGVNKTSGTYTHAEVGQLVEGTTVTVLPAGDTINEYDWTGEGGDNSVATAGNWSEASVKDALTTGMVVPVFARGGTRAEVGSNVNFGGIKFDSAGDFEVASAASGVKLQLGTRSLVTEAPASGQRAYSITNLPISFTSPQTMTIATNTTLTITDGLNDSALQDIKLTGSGKLVLQGVNRFNGAFKHPGNSTSELVLRGLVSSSDGSDQGDASYNGTKTITVYVPFADRDNKSARLRLENATIEKPLAVSYAAKNSVETIAVLTCGENTTNVISGDLLTTEQNFFMGIERGASLLIKGRIRTGSVSSTVNSYGILIYSNATAQASLSDNIYMRGCTNLFYGANWRVQSRLCCDGGHGVMMNDNVFAPDNTCNLVMGDFWGGGNSAGDLNLNGTRQTFPRLMALIRSGGADLNPFIFTPADKPAVLAITGTHTLASTNNANIIGPVTIEKSGDKAFCTVRRVVETTGNLLVSGGVFDIDVNSAYPNVPLAEFSGTSTLALHKDDQLSRDVILKVKGSAKISVPAGVTQTVRELWFGEATRPVRSGIYGGSECTVPGVDTTYAAYFTGAGCVKAKRLGTTMVLR